MGVGSLESPVPLQSGVLMLTIILAALVALCLWSLKRYFGAAILAALLVIVPALVFSGLSLVGYVVTR